MLTDQSANADQFIDLLGRLAQRSRKHGFSLLIGTQDPTGQNFPTALQRNVKVAAAGQTNDDSYLSRYIGITGAKNLLGKGDFLYKASGQQRGFKGFSLTDADITEALQSICAIYGTDDSTMIFVHADKEFETTADSDGVVVIDAPAPEESQAEADARRLLPYIDEAIAQDGRLRNGWGTRLIEVLYGEPKPNAGNYSARLKAALHEISNLTA